MKQAKKCKSAVPHRFIYIGFGFCPLAINIYYQNRRLFSSLVLRICYKLLTLFQ